MAAAAVDPAAIARATLAMGLVRSPTAQTPATLVAPTSSTRMWPDGVVARSSDEKSCG